MARRAAARDVQIWRVYDTQSGQSGERHKGDMRRRQAFSA
jgi:hypothetical protein